MDRLEEQLRAVLTDERLGVPLAPGAVQTVHEGVRRRKRRNAIVSASASFVLVAGGIAGAVGLTQGGRDSVEPGQTNPTVTPPPAGKSQAPSPAGDTVPWSATPYDPASQFILPGSTPDPSVPWCKADQLSLTASEFQGATGSASGALTASNNGVTCGLQGLPVVTGFTGGDTVVATSTPADPFVVHPWVELKKGQQARTGVQIFGDGSRCLGPVTRLTADLGHGGGTLAVDLTAAGGGDVTPRCGTAPRDKQLDHYSVSPAEWIRPNGTPRLPMSDFSAEIRQQPPTAMQGTTLRYQVLLSTGGATVDPCLPYREQVVSLDGTQTGYGTSYFRMNCSAMGRSLTQGYILDMELALPRDLPVGSYVVQWQTPIEGLDAGNSQTLQVTAAPPMCKQDQLDFSIGASGAATTHYEQDIVIRNTSGATCSLRGYPGVQFVNADGHALPTKPHHGASFMWRTDSYETVRLGPGAVASFALGGVDYDTLHQRACDPVASVVKIIAPGLVTQVPLDVRWPYCLGGKVDVSPVVPGFRGPR